MKILSAKWRAGGRRQFLASFSVGPIWQGYGLEYTYSDTVSSTIFDRPFLEVIVRDFKSPMPWSSQILEIETLEEFLLYIPREDKYSDRGTTYSGGNKVIFDYKKRKRWCHR